MEWYWIVYIVGLIIVELRLFYKAGIAYGEAVTDKEKDDVVGPVLFSAFLLLFWPIVIGLLIVFSPVVYIFKKGTEKGTDLKKQKEMWNTIKD